VLDTSEQSLEPFDMSASSTVALQDLDPSSRAPRRVRHEPRRRRLDVERVERIAAHMIRVTLGGDLEGFTSLGFDDHIKLFFPDGPAVAGGEPPTVSRDYTPRRYDPTAKKLDIEFVIHDAGPATRWAEQARAGQSLDIGGPRGSFIIPTNFDWHLLIGDDTALPAIARRLAELPAGTRAVVLAEVDGPADELTFASAADVTVTWAHRQGAEAGTTPVLAKTLKTLSLPRGDFYAWVACESLAAKALRAQLIADHGANPKWMRAAGYWRRGAVAVHDTHND
jgi:NADPH-dependent ferric siderophore reductase